MDSGGRWEIGESPLKKQPQRRMDMLDSWRGRKEQTSSVKKASREEASQPHSRHLLSR